MIKLTLIVSNEKVGILVNPLAISTCIPTSLRAARCTLRMNNGAMHDVVETLGEIERLIEEKTAKRALRFTFGGKK